MESDRKQDTFLETPYISRDSNNYTITPFIVSFDIASLFTNVPLEEGIFICADFLYRSPLTSVLSFPETVFMELMELVSFSFNDTLYRQVDGISMGFLWTLFLLIFLLGFMRNYSSTGSPSLISIYVTRMTPLHVLVHVVKLYHPSIVWMIYIPSLTFTMDEEKDKKITIFGCIGWKPFVCFRNLYIYIYIYI